MDGKISNTEQTPKEKPTGYNTKKSISITPVHLQLPEAPSKSLERYMSPTDMLISPVSRRILARNQRGGIKRKPAEINVG